MNKKAIVTVVCASMLGLGALAVAQDETPWTFEGYTGNVLTFQDPDPVEVEGMVNMEGNLENVTGDSQAWYGQVVTLEGEVGDFISTRMFTLGEGAALDNDQVLVVNNSSHTFPPEVMEHTRIRLTGRIHPSLEAVAQGTPVDFGDLFGREVNLDATPAGSTETTDTAEGFNGDFTMLDSSLNTYGFTTGDHVTTVQELDRNLETLTEEQRLQLADALEQDAAANEATYPTVSQAFRDAATALRNNDIAAARTALQTAMTEIEAQSMMAATPVEADTTMETDTSPMMSMDMDMSRPNMVEWAYQGLIPEDLDNFTILEVFSIENVDFVEFGPGLQNN